MILGAKKNPFYFSMAANIHVIRIVFRQSANTTIQQVRQFAKRQSANGQSANTTIRQH
jgi:hypothetical protein